VPCVHRRSLPIHQVGRELRTRGGHNVAEFAVDGLGEIAGKQQGEQSASLLVRRARLEPERLDYSRRVIGELGYVKWLSVVGRAADPAVVEEDELVGRRKPIDE